MKNYPVSNAFVLLFSIAFLWKRPLKIEKIASRAISMCVELFNFIHTYPIFRLFKLAFTDIFKPLIGQNSYWKPPVNTTSLLKDKVVIVKLILSFHTG